MDNFKLDGPFNALNSDFSFQNGEEFYALFIPQFKISEIGITHRWITHWDKYGLIDLKREDGGWRKFTFIEYVWLKVIVELRAFNIPLGTIKKLKEALFEVLVIPGQVEFVSELLLSNEAALPESLTKEMIFLQIETLSKIHTHFFFAIVSALQSRAPFSLLVCLDGSFQFLDLSHPEVAAISTELMHQLVTKQNFISINIQPIFEQFYTNEKVKDAAFDSIAMLSSKEKEIVAQIRKGGFLELRIKETGKNEYLLSVKSEVPVKEIEYRVRGLMAKGGYEEINLIGQNGNVVTCHKTEKIRI